MRTALVMGVVLALATPVLAQDDFTTVVKEALASAEPTTAVLRGFSKMHDFDMNGASVRAALDAAGAKADGQVAQVLGDVTRLTKKKDRVTIERGAERLIPIVVAGETKGWVKLDKKVEFRIRSSGESVALDKFDGIQLGKTSKKLYDLWNLNWTPGSPDSTLSVTAGWGFFSETNAFKIPNPKPVPAPAPTPPPAPPVVVADAGLPPPPVVVVVKPEPKVEVKVEPPVEPVTEVKPQQTVETPGILKKVASAK